MADGAPGTSLPAALVAARDSMVEDGRGELGRLLPAVYDELRALAGSYFSGRAPNHTLQPTALVHEVYAKLAGADASWSDREHFLALAATVMRQVLADHAKAKSRQKRGGDWQRVTVSLVESGDGVAEELDLVALDAALAKLETLDERQARIVELRFLAGLSVPEVAGLLGVSRRTVELDWRGARAWLRRELDQADDS